MLYELHAFHNVSFLSYRPPAASKDRWFVQRSSILKDLSRTRGRSGGKAVQPWIFAGSQQMGHNIPAMDNRFEITVVGGLIITPEMKANEEIRRAAGPDTRYEEQAGCQ
jgi:hypothetical protein